MNQELKNRMLNQALGMAYNYLYCGRPNKAIETIVQVKKIMPEHDLANRMMHFMYCRQIGDPIPDLSKDFGEPWLGESLEDKSIEIFCDQGIGDTLNLLRYVKAIKDKYDCKIILNCYAFYDQFEKLLNNQSYIDIFTGVHETCDYITNIMSIPALLNGLEFDFYYPVHFKEVMEKEIPPQVDLGEWPTIKRDSQKKRVGLVWQTNVQNYLALVKSIPVEQFEAFNLPGVEYICLQPNANCPEWIEASDIKDLTDTISYINSCDVVISVDTAVLHLAGILGKPTFGLIPHDCDPRWGQGEDTVWYPSAKLFRQDANENWSHAIEQVRERLVSFIGIV